MIDAQLDRSLGEIMQRMAEVRRGLEPGFTPDHHDARARVVQARTDARPTAVVAGRDNYFIVSDSAGRRSLRRDGEFDDSGEFLRSNDGSAALGLCSPAGAAPRLAPIAIPPALRGHVAIDAAGQVSASSRGGRVVLGTLALARYPAATTPDFDGASVRASGVPPIVGAASQDGFDALRVRSREVAQLDVRSALDHLRDSLMAYKALILAQPGKLEKMAASLLK